MKASEMTNIQIADYILSLQSDVDGFPFSSNEIIREAAKRLLTDGDDDISKDAEIAELRECLREAEDALDKIYKCIDNRYGVDASMLAKNIIADAIAAIRWKEEQ